MNLKDSFNIKKKFFNPNNTSMNNTITSKLNERKMFFQNTTNAPKPPVTNTQNPASKPNSNPVPADPFVKRTDAQPDPFTNKSTGYVQKTIDSDGRNVHHERYRKDPNNIE